MFESSLLRIDGASIIVTSVLSNFLCKACTASDPAHLVEVANAELSSHVALLVAHLRTNPQTRVVVVPPLPRLDPTWFNSYLPCFTSFLIGEVGKYTGMQIRTLAPFVALPTSFESDGVHLTSEVGESFIEYVLSGVDQIFPASMAGAATSSSGLVPLGHEAAHDLNGLSQSATR